MSTYYNFYCTKCKKYQKDISFTRQAWGWGNADIINSFQFLMKHTDTCGHENIKICSEHDEIMDSYVPPENHNGYTKDTSEELNEYFPRSDDWQEKVFDEAMEEHEKYLKRINEE